MRLENSQTNASQHESDRYDRQERHDSRLLEIEAGNILADTTLMQITVVANSTIGIEPNETPHIEVSQCFLAWNH